MPDSPYSTGVRAWLRDLWSAEAGTVDLRTAFRWMRSRLEGEDSRVFRRFLLLAIIVGFFLAPLTSWSVDTPDFVAACISLLYNGSPYAANQFFSPPLGPLLSAPFFALLSVWISPQSLITSFPSIAPAAAATSVSTRIPNPFALLALKGPLISALCLSSFCVLNVAERIVGRKRACYVAGAWLLNPLVLWSTAVHGEVDILAATAVLVFLVSTFQRWYFLSGVVLVLGVMSKAYPLVLLPMGAIAVNFSNRGPDHTSYSAATLRYMAGVGVGFLPFLAYVTALESLYGVIYSQATYGGFSFLLLFNPGIFQPPYGIGSGFFSTGNAVIVHDILVALYILGLAGSMLLAYLVSISRSEPSSVQQIRILLYACVWPIAGALMFQSSPQSENLLVLLPVMVLLACCEGIVSKVLYWLLSAAGLLLYFTLLTPLAYFYPLATFGGPRWVATVNSVVIRYAFNQAMPPHDFWVIAGLIGATCILMVWLRSFMRAVQVIRNGEAVGG